MREPGFGLLGARVDLRLDLAQLQRQRNEPLLCAIVEVASEAAPLRVLDLDDAGA
jgi:hypothetical protein